MVHDDPAARERLIKRVVARANAGAEGSPESVMGYEALEEADELLEQHLVTPDGVDLRVLNAVGMLHWNRCSLMGEAGAWSGEVAQLLLTPLCQLDPASVPRQLAEYLERRRNPLDATVAGRFFEVGHAWAAIVVSLGQDLAHGPAVDFATLAIEHCEDDNPRRPTYLSLLGELLLRRRETTGESTDLDGAVELLQESCRLTPEGDPGLLWRLYLLGGGLTQLAERTKEAAPLREAADVVRRALRSGERTDEDLLEMAVDVLIASAGRPRTDGIPDPGLVADVVAAARDALAECSPSDLLRPIRVAHLALALAHRGGDEAPDGEVVPLLCSAIRELPQGDETRVAALVALGNLLGLDAVSPLDDDSFRLATGLVEEEAATSDPGEADHLACLTARAAARERRWHRGDEDMLGPVIEAYRAMSDASPPGPERSRLLGLIDDLERTAGTR